MRDYLLWDILPGLYLTITSGLLAIQKDLVLVYVDFDSYKRVQKNPITNFQKLVSSLMTKPIVIVLY